MHVLRTRARWAAAGGDICVCVAPAQIPGVSQAQPWHYYQLQGDGVQFITSFRHPRASAQILLGAVRTDSLGCARSTPPRNRLAGCRRCGKVTSGSRRRSSCLLPVLTLSPSFCFFWAASAMHWATWRIGIIIVQMLQFCFFVCLFFSFWENELVSVVKVEDWDFLSSVFCVWQEREENYAHKHTISWKFSIWPPVKYA